MLTNLMSKMNEQMWIVSSMEIKHIFDSFTLIFKNQIDLVSYLIPFYKIFR
jgi:hypothetical protein